MSMLSRWLKFPLIRCLLPVKIGMHNFKYLKYNSVDGFLAVFILTVVLPVLKVDVNKEWGELEA